MNSKLKYLAGSAITLSLLAGLAALRAPDQASGNSETVNGAAASMHFTDDSGKPRSPSAAERAALANAFQADLARLTKGKHIPQGSQRQPNGSFSAVVGTNKMRFLTVTIDGEGNAIFGHSNMNEQGHIEPAAAIDLPEM